MHTRLPVVPAVFAVVAAAGSAEAQTTAEVFLVPSVTDALPGDLVTVEVFVRAVSGGVGNGSGVSAADIKVDFEGGLLEGPIVPIGNTLSLNIQADADGMGFGVSAVADIVNGNNFPAGVPLATATIRVTESDLALFTPSEGSLATFDVVFGLPGQGQPAITYDLVDYRAVAFDVQPAVPSAAEWIGTSGSLADAANWAGGVVPTSGDANFLLDAAVSLEVPSGFTAAFDRVVIATPSAPLGLTLGDQSVLGVQELVLVGDIGVIDFAGGTLSIPGVFTFDGAIVASAGDSVLDATLDLAVGSLQVGPAGGSGSGSASLTVNDAATVRPGAVATVLPGGTLDVKGVFTSEGTTTVEGTLNAGETVELFGVTRVEGTPAMPAQFQSMFFTRLNDGARIELADAHLSAPNFTADPSTQIIVERDTEFTADLYARTPVQIAPGAAATVLGIWQGVGSAPIDGETTAGTARVLGGLSIFDGPPSFAGDLELGPATVARFVVDVEVGGTISSVGTISVNGNVHYDGTLSISMNYGALVEDQTLQAFDATSYSGRFDTIALSLNGTPVDVGPQFVDASNLAVDGTITVFAGVANGEPCSVADVATPYQILDLLDIDVFIQGFLNQNFFGDIAEPFGVWDLVDIDTFIVSFTAGCP
ncbi:MAG: hypothetical protein AAGI53_13375 [Planctomycetota bacterium]